MRDTCIEKHTVTIKINNPYDLGKITNPLEICYGFSYGEQPLDFESPENKWEVIKTENNYKYTNEFLNRLQDATIADSDFVDFFKYKKVSMWQFLPSYIWSYFFRTIELINLFNKLFTEIQPNKIYVYLTDDIINKLWYGTLYAISKHLNINIEYLPSKTIKIRDKQKLNLLKKIKISSDEFLFEKRYDLKNYLNHFKKKTLKRNKNKIIIVTHARHWIPTSKNKQIYYDEQFFPLLNVFNKNGWTDIIGIDCPYFHYSEERLKHRMLSDNSGIIWRNFLSYGDTNFANYERLKARKHFQKKWEILQSDKKFLDFFKYDNIDLMYALKYILENCFLNILPECALLRAKAKIILKEECPTALILTYETGQYARALNIEAQLLNLPTIGLMHGIIFDNHYDYMHKGISNDVLNIPGAFTVPKITCVWGPVWENVLINIGSYPKQAVKVTGNWRYDNFNKLLVLKETKQFFQVDLNKKIILILSSGKNVINFILKCLKVVKLFDDYTPLIKLHPADDPEPIRDLLAKYNYGANILITDFLFDALVISDIVISQISTVISEAILFNKPTILVDFENEVSFSNNYLKYGACLSATSEQEILKLINTIINDVTVLDNLKSARDNFIADFFYKLDRKAAERVVGELNKLLK